MKKEEREIELNRYRRTKSIGKFRSCESQRIGEVLLKYENGMAGQKTTRKQACSGRIVY